MVPARTLRKLRPVSLLGALLAVLAPVGCGNQGEGTIQVSPEARARLRGGPKPAAVAAKPGVKKQVNVKELMRRNPAG